VFFISVFLYKDGSHPIITGIAMDFHRQIVPWMGQDWRGNQDGFHSLEATLMLFPPGETLVLFGHIRERAGHDSEIRDGSPVIRTKAKEALYFLYTLRNREITHGGDLFGIWRNPFATYNKAQDLKRLL
jgi:hypothetical protein